MKIIYDYGYIPIIIQDAGNKEVDNLRHFWDGFKL